MMGDIHTKKRNRLDPQKVRDTAVVKLDILREHELLGINPHRQKRHVALFPKAPDVTEGGSSDTDEDKEGPASADYAARVRSLHQNLIDAVDEDEDPPGVGTEPELRSADGSGTQKVCMKLCHHIIILLKKEAFSRLVLISGREVATSSQTSLTLSVRFGIIIGSPARRN